VDQQTQTNVTERLGAILDDLARLGVYPTRLRMERATLTALYVERYRSGGRLPDGGTPMSFQGIPVDREPLPPPPDYYTDNPPR
jgi:hypothetical protein